MTKKQEPSQPALPSAADFLKKVREDDGPIVDKRCHCCAIGEELNADIRAYVEHRKQADEPGSEVTPQSWSFFRTRYLRPKYGNRLPASEKGIRIHAERHLKIEIPL